jgi:hypothetical protein
MVNFLEDPIYSLVLTFIEGSALNENDLKRTHVDKAVAVFILTNKFSSSPDDEDAKTILQQVSIQRYINFRVQNAGTMYCMQLLRPENRRHIVPDEKNTNRVVCLNEIKMGLCAKSILFPGMAIEHIS